jgi:hypothetical protein
MRVIFWELNSLRNNPSSILFQRSSWGRIDGGEKSTQKAEIKTRDRRDLQFISLSSS